MSDERVDAIKAEVRRFEVERDLFLFNRSCNIFWKWQFADVSIDVHLAAQYGANFPHRLLLHN